MERLNLTYVLRKHGIEKVSAQTIPNTYSEILYASLYAEQVNNRNSAGWKKANFIICNYDEEKVDMELCLYGWKLLASQTMDQILIMKSDKGKVEVFDWNGRELCDDLDTIFQRYKLLK